jgi:tetratricopeptide (TPR) repeat protein
VNPQHATGYSNLGFLYLRKGQLELAVESLLRALEVDPQHNDATDHLCDVLRALIDALVLIALTEGFLLTQPEAEAFDEYNRHRRARDIGLLIAKMGQKRIFQASGNVLDHDLLLMIVIAAV